MLEQLQGIVGADHVLTGADTERWRRDWTGKYRSDPLAVVRPGNIEEVAALVRLANDNGTAIVPVSGNTGLSGGAQTDGGILLSLDRMNRIRDLRVPARLAVAEAGVILSALHDAADDAGLVFPLTFGARGSAMVGGFLSTNAGGSNVVRYGNTRDLVLGIEAVLPTGEVVDLMSELHKDNSGYDLRHLLIGAEGTLGIITAAVLKLAPKPRAYATAMVAVASFNAALDLLNRLQEATGGMVEAFEYLSPSYLVAHEAHVPGARPAFDTLPAVPIMVEIGSTVPADATPGPDGAVPLTALLEETLAELFEEGAVLDAHVAQSDAQRGRMWERREAAAEVTMAMGNPVLTDVAVPLDQVGAFIARADAALDRIDPRAWKGGVAHLGDGNVHYSVSSTTSDAAVHGRIVEAVEEIVRDMRGSFSAEHGIGQSKLASMRRRKNPVALAAMRAIKGALDPNDIMNPGKLLP